MIRDLYISQDSKKYVQVLAECIILPEKVEGICYQEMWGEYVVYTVTKSQFEQCFCKINQMAEEVPKVMAETLEPQKIQPMYEEESETVVDENDTMAQLLRFLDADTYREKIQILERMKDELSDHLLNNMAVSLDLSIEDGVDGYEFIMSELKIRSRFEGKRGERL